MRRRDFITLLGGAATTWPVAARAQQPERMRRIGVLQYINESDPELQRRVAVFVQGLQKLGWREGANLVIDYRYGADDSERMRLDAAELVGLKPDVIWTSGGLGLLSLKRATQSIPIVFTTVYDPDDKGQDPENQLCELRAWCANAGHKISKEYVDYDSGRKGAEKRKQFAALFDDAAKRKFDCVLFWALDRFSREGMTQTIIHLQRLSSNGVAFHSYTEPHLATDNELVRNILLALLSSLAKVEAQKISERTRAGMSRARAKGIKIGRPKLAAELRRRIAQRAAKGETAYGIAKALGLDRHTAAKYMQT